MNVLSMTVLCPTRQSAEEIAEALLSHRIAAAASIGGAVRYQSLGPDAGTMAEAVPLSVQTRPDLKQRVEDAIRRRHPSEVPHIRSRLDEATNDFAQLVAEVTRRSGEFTSN
ncbi:divalent cation tolerance protein CutA [Pseudooceanicola sp. C21-150M6]|uniref:divalent cation tolerance protein CutA n=1 Tax=Pseudooceanicola sp. C21-150M6 TaxID=3434355 RepID=UPI003D7FA471